MHYSYLKAMKKFTLRTTIKATPKEVYEAWLDSEAHSAMTGGSPAIVNKEEGEPFAAHNAYLWGKNLQLIPNQKIVQSWRSIGFKSTDEDSIVEVTFKKNKEGTLLTLTHTKVPDQEEHVKQGWVAHYFEPMAVYFSLKRSH